MHHFPEHAFSGGLHRMSRHVLINACLMVAGCFLVASYAGLVSTQAFSPPPEERAYLDTGAVNGIIDHPTRFSFFVLSVIFVITSYSTDNKSKRPRSFHHLCHAGPSLVWM